MPRATRFRALALSLAAGLGLCLAAAPGAAQAGPTGVTVAASYLEPLPPAVIPKTSNASRWASLGPQQCLAEVKRRKLGVTRSKGFASGVSVPVRITGPIGGVRFVTPGGKSP